MRAAGWRREVFEYGELGVKYAYSMNDSTALLEQGQHALRTADWETARRVFESALEQQASPNAHDGLGLALWWLNDIRAAHHQRTLAYQQFKQRGDTKRAAMLAMWLAREQAFLGGNVNAMNGWFARAERLLNNIPHSVEHAWLALLRASLLAPPDALEHIATETLDAAHEFRDDNLEGLALAFRGIARIMQTRVAAGMADLDEAMTAALGGEIELLHVSEIFCLLLSACDLAGDLGRTEQWCRTAQQYAEQNHFPFLAATCRVTYGSLLTAIGKWEAAESELVNAIRSFESGHYALRAQAVIKLADLRVWQGRLQEAEALMAGLEDQTFASLPLARLALARGEKEIARAILEQHLAPNRALTIDQAPLLRLLVDVYLVLNQFDDARAATERLLELANRAQSDLLLAQVELAQGQIARFENSPDAARFFYQALERLRKYDQALLAARARFELAQLARDTDRPAAITWARAALASFERMGAKQDANQAAHFLHQLGVATTYARSKELLSAREQEVLQLLGEGLTNREIAERLVVSPKTIEHHVTQILSKLGARSRAEAAAMAARR